MDIDTYTAKKELIYNILEKNTRHSNGSIYTEACLEQISELNAITPDIVKLEKFAKIKLANSRISFIENNDRYVFKSARELDRYLDEVCINEYSEVIEIESLSKKMDKVMDNLRTMISYMNNR